jgi:nucleotide-binding universal stress UspA family protein
MSHRLFLPLQSYPDPTPKSGLVNAFEMASKLQGDLTALVHEVDIADIQNVLADALIDVSRMVAAAERTSRDNAGELIDEVNRLAASLGLRLELRPVRSRPEAAADLISAASRTFDYSLLIATGQSDSQLSIGEAVLFGSGGPSIVLPPEEMTVSYDTATVAWDGTRAAARALHDAIPVLKLYGRTTLLTADDDKTIDPASVAGAESLLRGHDIDVSRCKVAAGGASIGNTLQQAAIDRGAGLMVMGAYGHSRVREWILGGATRTVLLDCRLPVLMSH